MEKLIENFDHIYADTRSKTQQIDPEWLSNIRETSYENLKKIGFPNPKDELWKYTSTRDLLGQDFLSPSETFNLEDDIQLDELPILNLKDSIKIVILNGRFSGEYSDLSNLPKGCNLICFPEDASSTYFEIANDHEDQTRYHHPMSFTLLNNMLFPEIIRLTVDKNTKAKHPIELCFVHQADSSQSHCYTSSPRLDLIMGEKSHCQMIENHTTIGESQALINMHAQISVKRKATLERYIYQNCNEKSFVFMHDHAEIDQKAYYTEFAFNRGGKTVRDETFTKFIGKKSDCHVGAVALLHNDQHVDSTVYLDHAMQKCSSRQVFKNVLKDKSESVFQGKIHVTPNAQQTDGYQIHKALLLSDDAIANSKPELEIYADDVKCSHGSTTGFLRDEDLFYLKSRGICQKEAEKLLVIAFIQDALDEIKEDSIKEAFEILMLETFKNGEQQDAE